MDSNNIISLPLTPLNDCMEVFDCKIDDAGNIRVVETSFTYLWKRLIFLPMAAGFTAGIIKQINTPPPEANELGSPNYLMLATIVYTFVAGILFIRIVSSRNSPEWQPPEPSNTYDV